MPGEPWDDCRGHWLQPSETLNQRCPFICLFISTCFYLLVFICLFISTKKWASIVNIYLNIFWVFMQNTELRDTEETPNRVHSCLPTFRTIYALLHAVIAICMFFHVLENIYQKDIYGLSLPGTFHASGKAGHPFKETGRTHHIFHEWQPQSVLFIGRFLTCSPKLSCSWTTRAFLLTAFPGAPFLS